MKIEQPPITPEIVRQLAQESAAIRKAFRERLRKMWDIPPEEWRIKSR